MKKFGLEIHSEKGKIVHCVCNNGKPLCENMSFEFLGYCCRPRRVKSRKDISFRSFTSVVSTSSGKAFGEKIRKAIYESNTTSIQQLPEKLNPNYSKVDELFYKIWNVLSLADDYISKEIDNKSRMTGDCHIRFRGRFG